MHLLVFSSGCSSLVSFCESFFVSPSQHVRTVRTFSCYCCSVVNYVSQESLVCFSCCPAYTILLLGSRRVLLKPHFICLQHMSLPYYTMPFCLFLLYFLLQHLRAFVLFCHLSRSLCGSEQVWTVPHLLCRKNKEVEVDRETEREREKENE